MAVHNGARFVAESAQAILTQTLSDFEFLIVDDGSVDDSAAICRGLADARIRIITRPRTGLTTSLIAGLSEARGEFIARIDHDDISEPGRLERQVAVLDAEPTVALVGSNATLIDASGAVVGQTSIPEQREALLAHLLAFNGMVHSSLCFRRREIVALGGYRPQFIKAQDYDLLLRVSEAYDIRCLSDCLVRLRQHTGSITASDREGMQMRNALSALIAHDLRKDGHADPVSDASAWAELEAAVDDEFEQWGLARTAAAKRALVSARAAARAFDLAGVISSTAEVIRMDWRAGMRRGFGAGFPGVFVARVRKRLSPR